MRNALFAAGMFAWLGMPGRVEGREASPQAIFRMGIGAGLGSQIQLFDSGLNSALLSGPTLYLPMHLWDRIKIEPDLAYTEHSGSTSWSVPDFRDIRLGLGLFYLLGQDPVRYYIGLRSGLVASWFQDTERETLLAWFAGFAGGGEYFFNPRFSLGIELLLLYIDPDNSHARGYSISTLSQLMARFYF